MPLEIRSFSKDECTSAVQIAVDAYVPNPLRQVKFPHGMGPATQSTFLKRFHSAADDPDSHLWQIYDTEAEKMVAFAIWTFTKPVSDAEWERMAEERIASYPDARQEVLRQVLIKDSAIKQKVMGNGRWWELAALSVDPAYQRKGLGGQLMKWGTDELDRRQLPGFLVASEAGFGLYVKWGFGSEETWYEDLARWGGEGIYANHAMIRYPKEKSRSP